MVSGLQYKFCQLILGDPGQGFFGKFYKESSDFYTENFHLYRYHGQLQDGFKAVCIDLSLLLIFG